MFVSKTSVTQYARLLYRSTSYISMFDIGPQGIYAHINTQSSLFKNIYQDFFFHFNQSFLIYGHYNGAQNNRNSCASFFVLRIIPASEHSMIQIKISTGEIFRWNFLVVNVKLKIRYQISIFDKYLAH